MNWFSEEPLPRAPVGWLEAARFPAVAEPSTGRSSLNPAPRKVVRKSSSPHNRNRPEGAHTEGRIGSRLLDSLCSRHPTTGRTSRVPSNRANPNPHPSRVPNTAIPSRSRPSQSRPIRGQVPSRNPNSRRSRRSRRNHRRRIRVRGNLCRQTHDCRIRDCQIHGCGIHGCPHPAQRSGSRRPG